MNVGQLKAELSEYPDALEVKWMHRWDVFDTVDVVWKELLGLGGSDDSEVVVLG